MKEKKTLKKGERERMETREDRKEKISHAIYQNLFNKFILTALSS